MDTIIGLLKDTPIPTILVVSGIVFLFLALAGSVAGKLEMPPARQKWSAVASFLLLTTGLLLYILPGSREAATIETNPQETSRPATQPAAIQATQPAQSSSESAAPVVAASNPTAANVEAVEGCLDDFFSGVPQELINRIEIGALKIDLNTQDKTLAGLIIEEFGQPVAALTFAIFEDEEIFKIGEVVDSACQPTAFENISRGGAADVLQNYDTLQVTTSSGAYGLRFSYGAGISSLDTGKIE